MQWYEATPDRWKREQELASILLKNCRIGFGKEGNAFIRGEYEIKSEHGSVYATVRLRIEYPHAFPFRNQSPSVYLESHHDLWRNRGDSHIESDWRLCLYVNSESGIDFSNDLSFNDLVAVIHTFLVKQVFYQRDLAKAPITGEKAIWLGADRSHGTKGILEAVNESGKTRKKDACPCGSGDVFEHCCEVRLKSLTDSGKYVGVGRRVE